MKIARTIDFTPKELANVENAILTISAIIEELGESLDREQNNKIGTAFDIMAELLCMNKEGEKWFNEQGW